MTDDDRGPQARLSTQQRRVWDLAHDGGPAPFVRALLTIGGACDVARLARAIAGVCARDEILRTRFVVRPPAVLPIQTVAARPRVEWHRCDLTALPESAHRCDAANRLARAIPPLDVHAASPVRVVLFDLSACDRMADLSLSPLCSDAPGVSHIAQAIAAAYRDQPRARVRATAELIESPESLEPPLHYGDYAEWQHDIAASDEASGARRYWREVAQTVAVAELGQRASSGRPASVRVTRRLSADRWRALATVARSWACATDDLLAAVWATLLARREDRTDVRIAVACDGRTFDDLQSASGCFTRFLPVTASIAKDLQLHDLAAALAQQCAEHRQWQDLAPHDIGASSTWGFTGAGAGSEHDAAPDSQMRASDELRIGVTDVRARSERFTAHLTARADRDGTCVLAWASDIAFADGDDAGTLARIAEEYDTVLAQVEALTRAQAQAQASRESRPMPAALPIRALALTGEHERAQLLDFGTGPRVPPPAASSIQHLIGAAAARTPDATALVFGTRRVSYAELWDWTSQLANYLIRRGLRPASRVVVCLDRSPELIVAILAALKAGAAFVPIDPHYPAERRRFVLEHAGAAAVLTSSALMDAFAHFDGIIVPLDRDDAQIARVPDWPPPETTMPDDLAYVIYTSGSTGRPKGVAVTHRGLVHSTQARNVAYAAPVGTFLLLSSAAFDSAMAGIFWTLCDGGTLVLPADGAQADVDQLSALIEGQQVTHLLALPSLYRLLIDHGRRASLNSLRVVIVAGESCPRELAEAHARAMPQTALHNEYGPTEATVWSSVHRIDIDTANSRARVPIGAPIARVDAYVLDGELALCPIGVAGELYLAGAGLARGYLNGPALTASAFVPNPWSNEPGARMYRTGDRARWLPDGVLDFLGRRDHQVKIRGYRIEPDEIEAVLRQHPQTRDAIVMARDDGQGTPRLVAYIVAHAAADVSADDVRAFAAARLPEYMVPLCIMLPAFPTTPNGKVDRAALPAPEAAAARVTPFVPPTNDVEAAIARIWAEMLKRDEVGIEDNFFDLGGHSLLAVPLHQRLVRDVSSEIRLLDLFAYPTVQALAAHVMAARAPATASASVDATAASRRAALERQRALAARPV